MCGCAMLWFVVSSVLLAYGLWEIFRADDTATGTVTVSVTGSAEVSGSGGVSHCDEFASFCACQSWLQRIGMEQYASALSSAGIDSAPEIASLAVSLPSKLESLPSDVKNALKEAAQEYKESLILYQWFTEHELQKYFQKFRQQHHLSSIEDLLKVSLDDIQESLTGPAQLQDHRYVVSLLSSLRANERKLANIKDALWERFIEAGEVHKTLWHTNPMLPMFCGAAKAKQFIHMQCTYAAGHSAPWTEALPAPAPMVSLQEQSTLARQKPV